IPFSYIDENGIEHKPFEKHFQIKGMGLGSPKDPRTMKITPLAEGEFEVICSINKKTIKKKINIVRPTISSPHWIDKDGSSGNILATAGYDQEMYAYIKHLGLDGEEVVVEVYDAKDKKNPIFTSEKITVPVGSKEFTFHYSVKKVFKGKTEEEKKEEDRNRKDFQIFFKVKPIDNKLLKESLNEEFENNLLTITNKGDIVEAYFCNSDDTEKRKFIESGKVAHLKIYATNMKNREVEVLFFTRDKFHYSKNTTQNELTWKPWSEIKTHNIKGEPFHSAKGKINDKGELLVELDTSKYKWIKGYIIAVFKIKGKEGNEKGAFIKERYSLILHSYPQLTKLAENKATVKVGGLLGIGKVERVELEEEGHSCPRCTAPVTVAQLRELFPDVEEDTLKTVADTYTKYMKELQMDTCWNKAHFFAQAAIETGFKLHIKSGENMKDYTEKRLYEVFPSRFFKGKMVNNEFVPLVDPKAEFRDKKNRVFKSKELSQKASELIKSNPRDQNIANFVYANRYGNGNEASGDGWRFRGSGLIQLTFKDNFKMVNNKIEKLWGKSILTDSGADQVRENRELAVLTSMGYFAAKEANRKANWASSDQQIKEVCKLIGKNTKFGKSKNHEEKTIFFKNKSSKTFKTNECLWGHSKGKAPWMPFAISEIGQKAIAGKENNPRINDYFNASSNGKGWDEQNDWCGAFASWVFAQAGYTPPPLSCRAAMWQFWKQLDRPIYGAAAVIDWGENDLAESNGSHIGGRGHITFVVGESSDGKYYYCLGGNQGGVEGARMVKISKFEKSEIDWFVIPPSYEPTKEEYNLKIMADEADIDDESTTRSN
ncbi:hypothetical protein ACSQ7D_02845, partial [Capnocytophaga sp. G1920]